MSNALIELIIVACLSNFIVIVLYLIAKRLGIFYDSIEKSKKIIENCQMKNKLFLETLSIKDISVKKKFKIIEENISFVVKCGRFLRAYAYDNDCTMEINAIVDNLKKIRIIYIGVHKLLFEQSFEEVQQCFIEIEYLFQDSIVKISDIETMIQRKCEKNIM